MYFVVKIVNKFSIYKAERENTVGNKKTKINKKILLFLFDIYEKPEYNNIKHI
jgi:hypothetical protein